MDKGATEGDGRAEVAADGGGAREEEVEREGWGNKVRAGDME